MSFKVRDLMAHGAEVDGLQVVNDSCNYGTDALAYFRHYGNNNGTMILDKNGIYDYGLDIRTATTAQYGLQVGGQVIINSQARNYGEGLRLKAADGQGSTIILGATKDAGTNTYAWSINRTNENKFAILREGREIANGLLIDTTGYIGIGETSPQYRLHVNGDACCEALYTNTIYADDSYVSEMLLGDNVIPTTINTISFHSDNGKIITRRVSITSNWQTAFSIPNGSCGVISVSGNRAMYAAFVRYSGSLGGYLADYLKDNIDVRIVSGSIQIKSSSATGSVVTIAYYGGYN